MAFDPLATAADLAARNITMTAAEQGPVGMFLRVASAAVREAAGCPITQVTSTIKLPGTRERELSLPAGPVTSVSAVSIDGTTVASTEWTLTPNNTLWRLRGWQMHYHKPSTVTVTLVHGLVSAPEDIVDLVCRMATAALVALRAEDDGSGLAASPGVTQERIDDYSVTYDSETKTTEMELSERLRNRIATRFGSGMGLVRI